MEIVDHSVSTVSFNSWACKEVGIQQKPDSVFSVTCDRDKDSMEAAIKLLKQKNPKEAYFHNIPLDNHNKVKILMVVIEKNVPHFHLGEGRDQLGEQFNIF